MRFSYASYQLVKKVHTDFFDCASPPRILPTIPRALFLDVLKRISPVIFDSGDTAGSVKLDIVEGNMNISASSSEVGEANETIGIALKGDPISNRRRRRHVARCVSALNRCG